VRILLAAVFAVAFLSNPGCSVGNGGDSGAGRERRDLTPREKGELRARNDIVRGKQRVFIYGNPISRSNPRIDEESGLPVRVLIDCCVSPQAFEETEAYNRVMRESVRGRGGEAADGTAPAPPRGR